MAASHRQYPSAQSRRSKCCVSYKSVFCDASNSGSFLTVRFFNLVLCVTPRRSKLQRKSLTIEPSHSNPRRFQLHLTGLEHERRTQMGLQRQGLTPSAYESRRMTPTEQRYSAQEREMFATVYALKKFRGYIEGSPIVVRTDHESLKYFHTQRYLGRRLARFHDDISHFDVQIIYRPGRSQAAADALYADVPDSEYEPLYVHASELKPAEHEAIFGTLEGYRTNLLKGGVVANGNYSVRGKILYKNISTDNSPPPQYVVPTSFKNALELVSALHTDLGHLGINAVQDALRDRAWMRFQLQLWNIQYAPATTASSRDGTKPFLSPFILFPVSKPAIFGHLTSSDRFPRLRRIIK